MRLLRDKAQAATELAVFGSILIFVIGSIIRTSIQAGMDQNQSLKAMRWAMSQSLKGVRNGNKSRDSANVLVIEDRLSPDAVKFGSMERTPMVQAGSGTFSNTIFMPMDYQEDYNIPVMDVFVNGEHFAFTTGRFVVYDIQSDPNDDKQIRVWDLTNNIQKFYPKVERGNWKSNCATVPVGAGSVTVGCPIFFTIVPVNAAGFCPSAAACDNTDVDFNQRFDLNLNFNYDDDPKGAQQASMMWQWKPIVGVPGNISINEHDGSYPSYDVDFDRREEVIYRLNDDFPGHPPVFTKAVVQRVGVFDSQKGDVNLSVDETDRFNAAPGEDVDSGLQRDVAVYTQIKDGTYLEIKQGKAYVPETGSFVRSVNKKDQVDIISRMFRVSNDTGRFCPPGGSRPYETLGNEPNGLKNPVEYCVNSVKNTADNCFNDATVNATCFDKGINMIFIRSRIEEQRGRKWVTQTE
jgi:hypothetical protein